jgi:hypothetical protein
VNKNALQRARYHAEKRKAGIPDQLAHPALLTDRIQPLRRPVLRMTKTTRNSL